MLIIIMFTSWHGRCLPKNSGIKLLHLWRKKRSFAELSVRMGWRGFLAISNRPRERSFAEHSIRMGWRGFPLLQSRSEVRHIQSTKRAVVCGAFRRMGWRGLPLLQSRSANVISNRPREEKFFLERQSPSF